jgi:hypothetical protein
LRYECCAGQPMLDLLMFALIAGGFALLGLYVHGCEQA